MAHFAKLSDDNVVLAIHVVNNSVIIFNGVESEQAGIEFLSALHGHSKWKQTSYNARIRKNYAGIGYTYDESRDAFVPPKQYNSWVLNEDLCRWESPIEYPNDGKMYIWDEATISWKEITNDPI
jgi:hypothetical protein